jgi:hypothetical protein
VAEDRMITVVRFTIGLIWVLALLAGRGVFHSAAVTASPGSAVAAGDTTAVSDQVGGRLPIMGDGLGQPQMDLFGNEIETAVADYRFDRRGGMYERHSPETAIPKLGSPVS